MRRLQYISDLHLEFMEDIVKVPRAGKYLALLGDIGNPFKGNYLTFLNYTSYHWDKVFLIPGNHEYYNDQYCMEETEYQIKELASKYTNVFPLIQEKYELEDYTILGTTLWSHITSSMNKKYGDTMYIKYKEDQLLDGNIINQLHLESIEWIKNNLGHKKTIMLTHHIPSYQLIANEYQYPRYLKISDRYYSNLDYLMKDPITHWLYGHSHCTNEKYINHIFCGINAYGYPKQINNKKDQDLIRFINLNQNKESDNYTV